MKKFLSIFAIALVAAVTLSSCGGGSTPGAAAKKNAELIAVGNYEKLLDNVYYGADKSAEEIAQTKAMLTSLLTDKVAKEYEQKGGLKTVAIVDETIAEDGQTAKVNLLYTYGDGTTSEEDADMILIDGKWMMNLKK